MCQTDLGEAPIHTFHSTSPKLHLTAILLSFFGVACTATQNEVDENLAFETSEALWQARDLNAYQAFEELDPKHPKGKLAHQRLKEANTYYIEGIERLERGEAGARESLGKGVVRAPMNPQLYLRLARACQKRGLPARAAEYYTKFLAIFPDEETSEDARNELKAIDPQLASLADVLSPPPVLPAPPTPAWLLVALGIIIGLLVGSFALFAVRYLRQRGVSLKKLVDQSPEFHPAITYLIGSLRHELLKHRIGAAGDALAAISADEHTNEQLEFLRGRLFDGQPLVEAWDAHLDAFRRSLGHRVDLRRDRAFRSADSAIRSIGALSRSGSATEVDLANQKTRKVIRRAHEVLSDFDRHLADLASGLVRTQVNATLIEDVIASVLSEYEAGSVDLEPIEVSVPQDANIEVFQVDLTLILKNIVRNAIMAVAKSPDIKKVRIESHIELEETGEETVRICVLDSSPATLTVENLYDRRSDRGLGLVVAAIQRYGGGIEVSDGQGDFLKSVNVSFFACEP